MNSRELKLLGLLLAVLFIITAEVYFRNLGGSETRHWSILILAFLNLVALGVIINGIVKIVRHKNHNRLIPKIQTVITFWQVEYGRNPIMENGRQIPADPKIVLLLLVCDPDYVKTLDLPDIGERELNRYYTSMYVRMVDSARLPPRMSYRRFTAHMAQHLQGLTTNPVKPQSGNGLVNMIGEYDGLNRNRK